MVRHRQEYRASKKASQSPRSNDVVDMEVNCVFCKTRLYVPYTALDAVLASFRRVGAAILICHACEQAQLVSGHLSQSTCIND